MAPDSPRRARVLCHPRAQVAGFPKALLNELASVQALIGNDTAAIMLGSAQGESGVQSCAPCAIEDHVLGARHERQVRQFLNLRLRRPTRTARTAHTARAS